MSVLIRGADIGLKILLAWAVLAPFIYIWCFLGVRLTPWWSDPGEWLKYANALEAWFARCLGVNSPQYEAMLYAMWDQGIFDYPPLFFLVLILLKSILGPLQALKVMGVALFALQPLPIYFLAKRVTGLRLGGLIAAYAMAFMPIYVEMLGWGGYPNLLGLLLISTNIFFTISAMSSSKLRDICFMALTSVLIPFSHHLTSAIFLGILFFWALFLIVMGRTSKIKYLLCDFLISLIVLALYRTLLAYPSQFVLFNEAAYYALRVNFFEITIWALKTLTIVVAFLIIVFFIALKGGEVLQKEYQALLLAWFLFPIVATQSYLLGIAIDFNRVFFFIFQPTPIVIASPLSLIRNIDMKDLLSSISQRLHFFKKYLLTLLIIFLSVITSILIFLTGVGTVANVAGWYSSQDAYGDYEKFSALEWIKREVPPDSIFVADEYMGRWIEGYASRRTYLYMEPKFLFIKGQLERYYIASLVLLADKEIRNCYLRILDQAPYSMSYTPIICFWNRGEYKETLFINEKMIIEKLENLTLGNLAVISRACEGEGCIETLYINKDALNHKTLLMKKVITINDHKISIVYEAVTENITICANVSPKRSISLIEVYDGRAVMHTDIGKVFIESNAEEIRYDFREIKFYGKGGSLSIQIFMEKPVRNELNQTLVLESSKIIKENHISHIVVPRVSLKGLETLPEYQHLLSKFKVVYVNDRVIILDTNKIAD